MFCIPLKERNTKRLCRIGIRQVTFDRMVMILHRIYNSFSLFAMQLNYCNIQRVLFLLIAALLAEKQHIPILYSFV
jgi:hypothetical protein